MRPKILGLVILLALLAGPAACGAKPEPTMPAIAIEPATPSTAATTPEAEPAAAPTEAAPDPTATALVPTTRPGAFSQEELIEDARQLVEIIESNHPDPYIRGGGKIAFHRRLQRLLEAIPAEGMTRDEFVRLLRPFMGAIGDSHTDIWSDYGVNNLSPGGVPLRFDIVEQSLYVAGTPQGVDQDLIGATLVSVEGVPLAELVQHQERLRAENEYHALWALANEALWSRPYMYMQDLLPEWQDTSQVTVDVQLPSGEIQTFSFDLPQKMANLNTPATEVTLPRTNQAGLVYDFFDTERRIAYLRVDHMKNYRERCELRGSSPELCASIPSATETFRDLVIDMEAAGSETLIVDLRDNEGGNSAMSEILIYSLFGKDTILSVMTASFAEGGGDIRRISSLYLEAMGMTLEQVNQGRAVPLQIGDYDFSYDFADDVEKFQALLPQVPAIYEDRVREMPTFYAEYEAGTYAGYYAPDKVVVLVTPGTFSAGSTMLRYLYLAGATLVGTPSGQAANCFGNAKSWRLNHTGIEGGVSSTYYVDFPNDPEMGRVLPMHYPLTYEQLASYGFDPNAEFLYALELLPQLGE
jgi:hypothetical protein